ncbi:MAG TPA: D-2-hydroxyacid dehydrogenase family protein [Usitatibacter sp.]|nr:D-2-hydroxyacid dehydrogenase family protein [Usitatibacter sp.]
MSARKTIVVLDDYEDRMRASADWSPVEKLADVAYNTERLRGDALVNAVKDANAIVLIRDRTPFKADLLAKMPKLELFIFTGGRNTQLDFKALAARNIPVTNTAMSDSKPATTELTWALILAAAKRLETYTALLRKGGWRDGKGLPQVLKGERLGIIGFGEIGRMVGEVGKAFGMELVAWSPHMTPERAAAGGAKSVTLEELLKTSKVVTLHLVPSEETRKLLNAERFAMMRPDSILANTARSALIDMKALDEALGKGRPGFAALDVYDDEPLAPGYALAKRDNVVLSPHLGFVNDSSFEKFATGSVENLVNWLEGRPLARVQTG